MYVKHPALSGLQQLAADACSDAGVEAMRLHPSFLAIVRNMTRTIFDNRTANPLKAVCCVPARRGRKESVGRSSEAAPAMSVESWRVITAEYFETVLQSKLSQRRDLLFTGYQACGKGFRVSPAEPA